ncbi:MAG: endolytic transglycosylase MltG [Balneolaceae bacterium]|nr:endolytic transglycosylase MltG [Balneolaceae bacterium]
MNLFRKFSITKTDFITAMLTLLVVSLLVFSTRQLRLSANDAFRFSEPASLQIHETIGVSELVDLLIVKNAEFDASDFKWATRLLGWRQFKVGNYEFEGEYSYEVLLSKLALGIQDPVEIVILPGIDQERFSTSVSSRLKLESESLNAVFGDSVFLAEIGISSEELLGRMLPETYRVYWTSTPKEIIRRILKEFDDSVVEPFSDEANDKGYTVSEILTMASIVEWEAKLEDEKPIIAGLYWNRIDRGMRLEADPTVNFALGERRRLLFEDYKFQHPFNTYLNRGLPPAPIANPSLSTIIATLRPAKHDFLYMVANPEGGHEFSRTFAEHQEASERWRKWLREQYRIKRQKEREAAQSSE